MNGQTLINGEFTYSFNLNATRATWKSTTHGTSNTFNLQFGVDHRRLGSARNVKKTMEDGKVRHVLHTHPKWTPQGVIRGYFPSIKKLPSKPRLTGSIGFIKPNGKVKTDGARFFIYVKYFDTASRKNKNVKIFDYYKRYNGKLKYINIDLSKYAGKKASFELRVDTGNTPTQDWAAWYDMRISPEKRVPPRPREPLSTINKAVKAAIFGPTLKGKKIFGHTFNFEKSVVVKINQTTGAKTVYIEFDHHKRLQQDDIYYFKAVFSKDNKLISWRQKINSVGFIPKSRSRVGPPPFRKTAKGYSPATIDRLADNAQRRLVGLKSWKTTAKEISLIIAKTAVSYTK